MLGRSFQQPQNQDDQPGVDGQKHGKREPKSLRLARGHVAAAFAGAAIVTAGESGHDAPPAFAMAARAASMRVSLMKLPS